MGKLYFHILEFQFHGKFLSLLLNLSSTSIVTRSGFNQLLQDTEIWASIKHSSEERWHKKWKPDTVQTAFDDINKLRASRVVKRQNSGYCKT
jgi:hypothetical protein